ncbi:MAG: nucleotidyltransferase domain-containing protein [Candidatus Helarchaeota archaeon]|nr:nucleotidyltransferase domain-containing protein [Candidatus Helarchaeota archaeon]
MQLKNMRLQLNKTGINIPQKADKYLNSIVPFLHRALGDDLRSIIIFGSIVKGYCTKESDADILIVVSDKVSKKKIKYLNRVLMAFEIKCGYLKPKKNIIQSILYCVDKSTGMFISHFICREKEFLSGKFAKVFSVNKIMAAILAPNDIVMGSVIGRAHTLYGENLVKKTKLPKVSVFQLLKSAIMNGLTAIGGLITVPFDKRATLYEMESFKWSLLASYYYVHNDCPNINEIIQYFEKLKVCPKALKTWTGLRKKYQEHLKFSLFVPLNVLQIHLSVIGKPK